MKSIKHIIASSLFFLITSISIAQTFDGYALYNRPNHNTTYLIDKNGSIAHSWTCAIVANYTVHLKENGNLVRGGVYWNNQLMAPALSGVIQELDANANIVWEYVYSTSTVVSHHDFAVLPNGNVILTAYEVKTGAELVAAGYSGGTFDMWPTHFIELQPDGNGSATIVWEWHMWDHMIQDFDNTKANFGVVANNPELMDVNVNVGTFGGGDWFHVNGVDYNPTLDQLVFSSRYTSELYIIDHSTTTAEAASHAGGNAGMGGDFLYRWGNPPNYGSTSPQIIPAAVHDPRWVKAGRPNEGYIQFFNNDGGGSSSSTVEAINPPLSGYNYTSLATPSVSDWSHTTLAYSQGQSASDRMSNGNTFVNLSFQYMYEVDLSNNVIWQYNGPTAKAFRYQCDYPGITALLGNNPCGFITGVDEHTEKNVMIFPNPSNGMFKISGFEGIDSYEINVFDMYGNQVLASYNGLTIDLSDYSNGVYMINITTDSGETLIKKVSLIK